MPDQSADNRPSNVGDIRPGDLIFFRGRGWVRWLIRLFTGPFWVDGFSHVGIASYVTGYPYICLVDATTIGDEPCVITGKKSGVRARPLEDQLRAYDGEVIVYPLRGRGVQARCGWFLLAKDYADSKLGLPYDIKGAMRCRGSFLCGLLWWLFKREESKDATFCNKLAGNWLVQAELLRCDNVSQLNPTSLAIEGERQGAFLEPWRWTP